MRRRSFFASAVLAIAAPAPTALALERPRIALLAAGVERARLEPLIAELSALGYEPDIEQQCEGLSVESGGGRASSRSIATRNTDSFEP
jgi:hypothetical protein